MKTEQPEILVIYEGEAESAPVATIRPDGDSFRVTLSDERPQRAPFTPRQLSLFIQRMIDLPLKINALRRQAMPAVFGELVAGSPEHLEAMCRQTGPFRLIPREREN